MMFGGGYFGNGGCFGFFGIWHFIIIGAALIALAIWWNKKGNGRRSKVSVQELLKMKYINGELTEEEYINRKNTLNRK